MPALIVLSLAGVVSAICLRERPHASRVSFGIAAVVSALVLLAGIDVFLEGPYSASLGNLPGFVTAPFWQLWIDQLSAWFLVALGIVGIAASVYSISYVREYEGRYSIARFGALFNLFLFSLFLVFSASNLVLFLIAWELMSLSSYFLVVYEHGNGSNVGSGLLYLVMTHIGTALITVGLVLIALQAGTLDFSLISGVGASMDVGLRTVVFVLLLVGFGTKAGIVPLHVWLPRAHPAAPSSVSALMSGIMVKTAIFMLIRSVFQFLGPTDAWWGVAILLIGSVSALVGVLYAIVEKDLKRILAYSSIENIGIILIALGASATFAAYGLWDLSALALIAALLHSFNHAIFKALLFLGAGAVAMATGTRNVEQLGGLAKRMRWTGALFFVGVLSLAAIPPFNGFVSEWLVFQSLFLSFSVNNVIVNLTLAFALGMLALTGALAAAAFVRAYGIAFLGRPRSKDAEDAKEVPRAMTASMAILAILCLATGLMATSMVQVADSVSLDIIHVSIGSKLVDGLVLQSPAPGFSAMSPAILGIALAAILGASILLVRAYGGKRATRRADTWDCGTPLTSRNETTATGYSQPMNRLFNGLYRSQSTTKVVEERTPLIRKVSYSTSIAPVFERYLYDPLFALTTGIARRVGGIQTGSIQRYLAYIFATLVLLLLVFR